MVPARQGGYSGMGFFAGAFAWAASSMIGYILVPHSCNTRMMLSAFASAAGLLVAIAGGAISWRADRILQAVNVAAAMPGRQARIFIARFSVLSAAVFAFAMLLQLAASFIFNGCER
jgi:hypothetical protein